MGTVLLWSKDNPKTFCVSLFVLLATFIWWTLQEKKRDPKARNDRKKFVLSFCVDVNENTYPQLADFVRTITRSFSLFAALVGDFSRAHKLRELLDCRVGSIRVVRVREFAGLFQTVSRYQCHSQQPILINTVSGFYEQCIEESPVPDVYFDVHVFHTCSEEREKELKHWYRATLIHKYSYLFIRGSSPWQN